jgi:sporulation integral membrane protein YlbJ
VKRKIYDVVILLGLAAVISALVIYPAESVAAGRDGVKLCLEVVVPSLLPFFVVSSMVVAHGYAAQLGRVLAPLMRTLFNVGGECSAAFILGVVGGYPVGAKTAIALYRSGQCSEQEAERLLSFCNNSGPAFILGVVGAGVFSSGRIGVLLCLTHAAASVAVGVLFRNWKSSRPPPRNRAATPPPRNRAASHSTGGAQVTPFPQSFVTAVTSAVQSVLNISGFVIFFTILIRLLFLTGALPSLAEAAAGLLGIRKTVAQDLIIGIIELTSGVRTLTSQLTILNSKLAMAAFMLGWAGLSVHCQALSFICDSGLSAKSYILGKLLHGVVSAALVTLLFRVVPFDAPASAYLTEQVVGIATLGFRNALLLSCACSAALLTLFAAASRFTKRVRARRSDEC